MTKKETDSHKNVPREAYEKRLADTAQQRKKSSPSADSPATTSTGQPKKSETRQRTKCLPVRLTPAEHDYLKHIAADSGLKMGAYIRQKVLGNAGESAQRAPSPDKEVLAMILAHVGKIGGNVNQLAKRANTDGFGTVTEDAFGDMRAQISTMKAMLMVALNKDGH